MQISSHHPERGSGLPAGTVVVPVYNGAAYLRECLASILAQQEVDFELVVVDDQSTDGSDAVVQGLKDSRLRYLRNGRRLGIGGNWNRGLAEARGDWVCVFHQDDRMEPGNLRRKVAVLAERPEVGMVFSNARLIGARGESRGVFNDALAKAAADPAWAPRELWDDLLFAPRNPVCCPGVVLRRSAVETVGPFRENLPFTLDLEMWLRVAGRFGVVALRESLIAYRHHEAQETARFRGISVQAEEWRAKRAFLREAPGEGSWKRSARRRLARLYSARGLRGAYEALTHGSWSQAGAALRLVLQSRPLALLSKDGLHLAARALRRPGPGMA